MSAARKKYVPQQCCVNECQTKTSENTVFHKFPSDEKRKEEWIRACNITTKVTPDSLICGFHFVKDDYIADVNSRLRGLKPTAVPKPKSLLRQFEEYIAPGESKPKSPAKVTRKCSVPQCNSQDDKRSFHTVPKIEHIRKIWIRACGLAIIGHPYAHVCSAHFERADFITGPNSKKQVLRPDAFPSLNLPERPLAKVVKSSVSVAQKNNASVASTPKKDIPTVVNTIKNNKSVIANSLKKDKPTVADTSKTNEDEKVTTIIYVPENLAANIVTTGGSSLKNPILIGKQDSIALGIKNVFSQVQNSKAISKINNTKSQNSISPTQKVAAVRNSSTPVKSGTPLKRMKPDIQGHSPEKVNNSPTKVSASPNNQNKTVNQSISSDSYSHQINNVEIKNDAEGSWNKKTIIRQGASAVTLCADCGQYCKIEDEDLLYKSYKNSETLAAELLLELQELNLSNEDERILLTKKGIEICNKAIQKESIDLMELLTNDNELMAFTGINFELLNKLTKLVSNVEGISSARYTSPAKTRIVICLCKLRINLSFACLGMLFGITQQVCASNFFSMLKALSILLEKTIHWPKTEELLKDLPQCFQSFKQTRVILNCNETQIDKQRCSNCQQKVAENSQNREAVKLVLGVAPSGLVIFKSNVFESEDAHVSIFTQTNIMEKLDPMREAIMADKTLDIEAECAENNITLIKLPKLGKNKQFSKHDVELIKNISTARIHVDRTMHRFRMYKIMQTKVHWRILPYLDDVCTVIAGIVNMKNPIPPNEIDIRSVGPLRK